VVATIAAVVAALAATAAMVASATTAVIAATAVVATAAATGAAAMFALVTVTLMVLAAPLPVFTRGAVLVEAGAARRASAAVAAGQGQRATGAEGEKPGGHQCCHARSHKRSLVSWGGGSVRPAHRPQLDSVERERVQRGTPVAEYVGDPLQVVRETFVVIGVGHGA
jgi:hypothetical protein